FLPPGGRSRLEAEAWRHRPAVEDRESVERARVAPVGKGGHGARRVAPRHRGPPERARRGPSRGAFPGGAVREEVPICGEGDQTGPHGGGREAVPESLSLGGPARVATVVVRGRPRGDGETAQKDVAARPENVVKYSSAPFIGMHNVLVLGTLRSPW